ncbi:Rho/Rac/Cdc42-like GTPase guanine nucleotide exchange factor [Ordospora pajunii]|uniref:Rho/Rac/Cdc42-like GTPase guanine nucleotide exchange factor n=1 Tax=Ordospora pajunii TaxID=3039483 RepID=UPI00295262AC|nr:Rho/Rac/Cdc42-like GTPase guanine nucleotide exchange factor [Ordospora pajunii]KAH9411802.1 Rho/Rac/Cdc42-like GTPase guanine nucleotide exchange factor [Ordospora pajunii]
MSKTKKRIEALSELFESEKSYIKDLLLWERSFRMWILGYPLFELKIKYEICDRVFVNMERIRLHHQSIFEDMKRQNLEIYSQISHGSMPDDGDLFVLGSVDHDTEALAKLEYISIYENRLDGFKLYLEYVRGLSKAQFDLERLMEYHPEFASGVKAFLKSHNVDSLGIEHFLYRPSQKLARYPLLLNAVAKNEEDDGFREMYLELIEGFKMITKSVDREFNVFNMQFTIYRLGKRFRYDKSVRNQQCLGLFQISRSLLKEGNVLARSLMSEKHVEYKMFVFDHLVLACNIPQDRFDEICIREEPMPMTRLRVLRSDPGIFPDAMPAGMYSSLLLFVMGGGMALKLYFKDDGERDVYYFIIQKAVLKANSKLSKSISIEALRLKNAGRMKYVWKSGHNAMINDADSNEDVLSENNEDAVSEVYSMYSEDNPDPELDEAILDFIKKRESSALKRASSHGTSQSGIDLSSNSTADEEALDAKSSTVTYGTMSGWRMLFSRSECFTRHVEFPLLAAMSRNTENADSKQEGMCIFAMEDGGVYYRLSDMKPRKILDRMVDKVVYDSMYEILMYMSESVLYVAHFDLESPCIEEVILSKSVGNFFYSSTSGGSYIASISPESSQPISVFLFLIGMSKESIDIRFLKRMCVGFRVSSVLFCSERIVLACRDFEMIDMDTLRAENVLNMQDPFLPILFNRLDAAIAISILPISQHSFLMCFSSMGFIIDGDGRLKRIGVVFLWDCEPVEFKLAKGHVICLGHDCVSVFDMRTGVLIFTKYQKDLHFVAGSSEPLLHDGECIYTLVFE